MSYEKYDTQDATITVLRELALQVDGRLNEAAIAGVLDAFGYRRSREWIRLLLGELEEVGAIRIIKIENTLIAEATPELPRIEGMMRELFQVRLIADDIVGELDYVDKEEAFAAAS